MLPMILKNRKDTSPDRADYDLTVYKDQLTEIDKDLDRGVLSDDQATSARTEIERRMLAVANETTEGVKNTSAPLWLILVVVVTVPVGAFALYFDMGQPQLKDMPFASREKPAGGNAQARRTQISQTITALKIKIKKNPDDPNLWARLGQFSQMIGDMGGSVQAYEQLVPLTKRNPDALMVLGEALFMQASEVVTPAAVVLFKEAKSKSPKNPMSYYYLALERQMSGDAQAAMTEYADLLRISPSNGQWVPTIQARMKALADKMGMDVPDAQMLAATPQAAPTGPTQEQIQAAQGMSGEDQQAMIQTMVKRLADKMKANPNDLEGWRRLVKAYKVLGEQGKMADAMMQVERLERSTGSSSLAPGVSPGVSPGAAPGPTRQQIEDAQSMSATDQQAMIR
ncbi:MAG: c-type cytochrome biogenesis protein CcmI, partial [Magnetovibrio sp.]|nr:c-type cytochrome biogenesis protein CcmI [Magnetovibrio sp.]